MPVLPSQRHEAFAQSRGKSADEAYALGRYSANRKNAWRSKVDQPNGNAADRAEWSDADRLRGHRGKAPAYVHRCNLTARRAATHRRSTDVPVLVAAPSPPST